MNVIAGYQLIIFFQRVFLEPGSQDLERRLLLRLLVFSNLTSHITHDHAVSEPHLTFVYVTSCEILNTQENSCNIFRPY
jgi:hypothetical protein